MHVGFVMLVVAGFVGAALQVHLRLEPMQISGHGQLHASSVVCDCKPVATAENPATSVRSSAFAAVWTPASSFAALAAFFSTACPAQLELLAKRSSTKGNLTATGDIAVSVETVLAWPIALPRARRAERNFAAG